ncbi:hypothetical protein BDFB_000028 [Asbolus verrucosus]|uniref:Uncharacterized protein n=1 Tax=Asbolus verrucosus TaxID=1661398 RepID=A0A482VK98_ASBVE|nr:hypothetical protein BDFB_000028 [Asbolus verrucosus]
MESYYSSDEEIAWGPLTLREIKKELQKKPRKIKHRQTDCGHCTYSHPEMNPPQEKFTELETKSNTSGNSGISAYFTPNESFQPEPIINKNDLFLEQLTKVIEGEDISSYASALDVTNTSKPANDTILRILKSQDKYPEDLDKIQQTLVDNSIHLSSDEEDDKFLHNSVIEEVSATDSSDSDDDVIVITDNSSTDDSDEETHNIQVENLIKHEKRSVSLQIENYKEKSPDKSNEKGEDLQAEEETSSSTGTEELLLELQHIHEKQKLLHGVSGEDDSSLDENLQTVEQEKRNVLSSEIKDLQINHGLKWDRKDNNESSQTEEINEKIRFVNLDEDKLNMSGINYLPINNQHQHMATHFEECDEDEINCVFENPTPSLASTESDSHSKTTSEVVKYNKENIAGGLPEVIYKPAKKTVAATKKEITLPSSIQKLVQEPIITKHEKRVNQRGLNMTSVSRKLLEEDLTCTTVDYSLLNQSGEDISFVTKKQAFIK